MISLNSDAGASSSNITVHNEPEDYQPISPTYSQPSPTYNRLVIYEDANDGNEGGEDLDEEFCESQVNS